MCICTCTLHTLRIETCYICVESLLRVSDTRGCTQMHVDLHTTTYVHTITAMDRQGATGKVGRGHQCH